MKNVIGSVRGMAWIWAIFFLLGACHSAHAADGDIDPGFLTGASTSSANNSVYATAIQSDGKILIGGNFTTYKGLAAVRVVRVNADGTNDPTFNSATGPGTTSML